MSAALNIKRDCQCPRARHQHGTIHAYREDKCRCPDCRAANRRAVTAYRIGMPIKQACGSKMEPAWKAVEIIADLRARGYSNKQIADAGRWNSASSVQQLARPKGDTVTVESVRRLRYARQALIRSDQRGTSKHVIDATGTRRRLQALAVMGYSQEAISALSGVNHHTIADVQSGTSPQTTDQTEARVRNALRIAMSKRRPEGRGPDRARRDATARGYVPAAAWEDDAAMDDPDALPLASRHWWGRREALPPAIAARMHAATVERARRKAKAVAA